MSIFDLLQQGVKNATRSATKVYNTVDKTVFKGYLPGGPDPDLQRQEYRLKINEKFNAKQTPRLGEDLNKQIDKLPIIRHWNSFQEDAQRKRQEQYEIAERNPTALNQFSNRLHDVTNTLGSGLSIVLNAPIETAATLLHVDPNLLSKALTIAGLGRGVRGVKGVKPRLRTINQNVLPTVPTSTPRALPKSIDRTLNFKNKGGRLEWDGSGHATTEGLTLGIPQATGEVLKLGTKLSPVPTAPLVAANGNLNPFPSTAVREDIEAQLQVEDSAGFIRDKYKGLLIDIDLAKSQLRVGERTSQHLSTLNAEAGDYKRKLSLLLSTYADSQLVKDQRKFIDDLANAGDDPEQIRAALNRNFGRTKLGSNISGSSNLGPEFKLEAHHELYAIESALQLMNVPPKIRREVLRIQLDRGIRYGDHPDNYRGLFKGAHELAHPQGFSGDSDLVLVDKLRNMSSDSTAQEIADAMHDVALNSQDLSLKAGQSKAQIQTAWDFFEQILSPKEFQDFLDLGINFADTKNPLWQELRKFIEGSGRLNHVGDQSRALFDSMVLESESIA